MTRVTNMFGGLAFAILTVFALWTSTLTGPLPDASQPAAAIAASVVS
jgi:hypothetical protein